MELDYDYGRSFCVYLYLERVAAKVVVERTSRAKEA